MIGNDGDSTIYEHIWNQGGKVQFQNSTIIEWHIPNY